MLGYLKGSTLGPLLFLIFINDLAEGIQSQLYLFADDSFVMDIVNDVNQTTIKLNADLGVIDEWAKANLVDFNASKTKSMVVSHKRIKPLHPPLVFKNVNVPVVQEHKHLGLLFTSDFDWTAHIRSIVNKAKSKLYFLSKLKFKLSSNVLAKIYKVHIRSLIDYACTIYDTSSLRFVSRDLLIESVQKSAARIVLGATKFSSYVKMCNLLGWKTLSDRRKYMKLTLFFKLVNGKCRALFRSLLPQKRAALHQYRVRNANCYHIPKANKNVYKMSFIPSTTSLWNALGTKLQSIQSLSVFKTNIVKLYRKCIPYKLRCNSRTGEILLTRFVLGATQLRCDLFKCNLVDTPYCEFCVDQHEDYIHYFLQCPFYDHLRADLLAKLQNIFPDFINLSLKNQVNILINGNREFTAEQNQTVNLIVEKYITTTKRFD